jgi:Domain of Unknown Function with PDB structure (DUF3857)/Transglutaminase-like superfamily
MPVLHRAPIPGLIALTLLCARPSAVRADDWQPISPQDLTMKSEPLAPNAPAISLFRQVDRDDTDGSELDYTRVKILTEEGRKYADVEIVFDKAEETIRGIQARTIRPDGTIVNFNGTVYEKPVMQARGVKLLAKTFTMPDVQVGSIIEYRFRQTFANGYVFNSQWILSQDLFTKYAKFSLTPNRDFTLSFSWPAGLPGDAAPPKEDHGKIRMEARDVPAFVTEEYMPPENELKYRVNFLYTAVGDLGPEKDSAVYWRKFGKKAYSKVEDFIDKRRAMAQAVSQTVDPGDTSEVKLHKIYERVQRIRNLGFERVKSNQETDRENRKTIHDAEDVWTNGYGDGNQLAWLFLAMARAAGLEADPVIVSTRDTHFFSARLMNPRDLNSNVVLVTLDGKQMFLDPGIALAPFGTLPWSETAVPGLRLDKNGGSWITTPLPSSGESRIERTAHFKLSTAGTLEGKVTVAYVGQEALWRRHEELNEDDADRKQFLENQLKADIPTGADVDLANRPDWNGSAAPLIAEYDVKMVGWAAAAGQRALLPVSLFAAQDKKAFIHTTRNFPMYFSYPHQSVDNITIDLPENWQVSSVPKPRSADHVTMTYSIVAEGKNGSLTVRREKSVKLTLVAVKYFDVVRNFFQEVRAGDEEQAVLVAAKSTTAR